MKIVSALSTIKKGINVGLIIGNFDGVHKGHQFLIKKVRDDCQKRNLTLALMTFVPHPRMILKPEESHKLIVTYEEKRNLIQEMAVDYLVEQSFSRDFSTKLPEDFLNDHVLSNGTKVKKIYLGHDFAFGANKIGNFEYVKGYCKQKNIEITICEPYRLDKSVISSTKIKDLIIKGNIFKASKYLGRNFYTRGRVVKSRGLGKQLGFPTANINFENYIAIPKSGVYITKTEYNNTKYFSVTNIGQNPTVQSLRGLSVETHIMDFDRDIYGEEIKVDFLKRIRDEVKFKTINELIEQIRKDIELARKYLKR